MLDFRVDEQLCIECGECAADCPAGIISMDGCPRIIDEEGCLRCQHCLAVCPTGAISILGRSPDDSSELSGNPVDPDRLELLVRGRRSVRRYTGKDLEPALIDRLLAAACYAPTGVNSQSVLFTVVREGSIMARLRDEVMDGLTGLRGEGRLPEGFVGQYMGGAVKAWQEEGRDIIFRGAPHLLVTSAPKDSPCPAQDTLIALTTFQLLAHAHGVGTVWNGMFMMALSLLPGLAARLNLPGDHLPGYAMAFGEPAVEYHRTVQRGPALVNVLNS